jgi:hypothetical protein
MEVDMARVYHSRNSAAKHQRSLRENLAQFAQKRGVDYTLL